MVNASCHPHPSPPLPTEENGYSLTRHKQITLTEATPTKCPPGTLPYTTVHCFQLRPSLPTPHNLPPPSSPVSPFPHPNLTALESGKIKHVVKDTALRGQADMETHGARLSYDAVVLHLVADTAGAQLQHDTTAYDTSKKG